MSVVEWTEDVPKPEGTGRVFTGMGKEVSARECLWPEFRKVGQNGGSDLNVNGRGSVPTSKRRRAFSDYYKY